ncbi:AMP-dependent synthetase/ligase [Demequina zhanjiangensis]|uniref:AMP-dependent synthetase/ligase n=1 Tax=Demequina zhanjiangensis TaxID=3051659 RepID=A0ABT8G2J7_9MICO|nr:AMP-dependent synthetase/ligase [Demequina sp. SYSU T00b26]MDN4473361.1 AMP-dependent synthetase/ligase [Demequina sp. SYSU T00b26]
MQSSMTSPSLATVAESMNLTALLRSRAEADPAAPFAEIKTEADEWSPVSIGEFQQRVRAVAKGLIASGVGVGDRVGIMGDTSLEWSVMDFAVLAAGGVSVPIYPSSSAKQCEWIVQDAGIDVVAAQTEEQRAMLADLEEAPTAVALTPEGLDEVAAGGAAVSDADLDARTADVVLADLATIIYTSGTTGRPKGAMLTHGNFVVHCENIEKDPGFGAFVQGDTRVLLFLPLAHVFARLAMVLALSSGAVIGYTPNHKTLAADLGSFRPTWMPLVPRVLETIYNRADAAQTGLKKKIFRWSAWVARKVSMAEETGGHGIVLKAQYAVANALVLKKIRHLMGGQLGYVLAGGAKLTPQIGHFFRGLGVTVMQGYGLTETTAAHMGTPSTDQIMGTVGHPIAGCEIKVADDGEILARGVNLFAGYWNAPDATAAVLHDGWFATGDLGEIHDGALTITGRKKEILVLSSGKNIQPAVLEDSLRSHPAIQDSVVIGDGRHFVSAVVALDPILLPAWLKAHDLPDMCVEDASRHERVRELIGRAIAAANEHVSRAEAIREFRILPREFTEAREELTASLKVRRANVMAHFSEVIDSIYTSGKGGSAAPQS